MNNFTLHSTHGSARRGQFSTPHGVFQTPCFMNVGTSAAIKGAVSSIDLRDGLNCQIELCNTYHLHVRPGEEVIRRLGGLHKFMNWSEPVLTDSGGFQVFSLAGLRKISEEGVAFNSHVDGAALFLSPEKSMQIQSALASDIAMAFDECPSSVAEKSYIKQSCERTTRWLARCQEEMARLNALPGTLNKEQLLFGINQGGVYEDLRVEHMKAIVGLDLDGYAVGGLAVGESHDEMYQMLEAVEPHMPEEKIRYLMGVGKPVNILEAVHRGVDLFDCVLPSRNARHGNLFTMNGTMNIINEKYMTDDRPIDESCGCPACRNHSRAYIRHLFKARETLGGRLAVMHNVYFYNALMGRIREALDAGEWAAFYERERDVLGMRV